MKTRNLIFAICLLLFTSCVVKSLHPFFTKDTISFDKNFIGEWKDKEGGKWKVTSYVDKVLKETPLEKLSKEELQNYKDYKHSYYVQRTKNEIKTQFFVNLFKIDNQTFLDFLPLPSYADNDDSNNFSRLLESHIVYTHSLVKYDVLENREISIKWLDEDKIEALFKNKKIKIKHEEIGTDEKSYLLTAKPKELQKFIKKYMASNDSKKWNTSTKFTLSKINGTD